MCMWLLMGCFLMGTSKNVVFRGSLIIDNIVTELPSPRCFCWMQCAFQYLLAQFALKADYIRELQIVLNRKPLAAKLPFSFFAIFSNS
jgi:hypothetical protein